MTVLVGGPFDGRQVTGNDVTKIWLVLYTLNGKLWNPPYGMFYQNFPDNVTSHGYRKQKTGNFKYAWSKKY